MDITERNRQIQKDRDNGVSYVALSRKYGVTDAITSKICSMPYGKSIYMEEDEMFLLLASVASDRAQAVRAYRSFCRSGVQTIEQMVLLEEKDLKEFRNIGTGAIKIIKVAQEKAMQENPELLAKKRMKQKLDAALKVKNSEKKVVLTPEELYDMNMRKKIGEKIRQLRYGKNMTQDALARLLHVSATLLGGWERGERYPDSKYLIPLASCLEVSIDEIMCYNIAGTEDANCVAQK